VEEDRRRMFSTARRLRIHTVAFFLLALTLGMVVSFQPGYLGISANPSKPQASTIIQPAAGSLTGTIFDHVIIIVMENEGIQNICNQSPPPCSTSGPAPYMAGLANNYTIGAQYLSLITTSQPNYVALLSGSMQGCTSSGCPSPITAPSLVDRFEAVGLTWKGYFENQTLPKGCDFSSPEPYTSIHNPFIVFQDITNNTSRCNKLVDVNPSSCSSVIDCVLVNDLNNATAPAPNFMWLTPNDCDNMRGSSVCGTSNLIGPGNTYLSKLVPAILNSRTFTTTRSALFITFDEGTSFCPGPFPSNQDCVYASWSGPVAKTSFGTGNLYNHYSFPKTIETNWNLPTLTTNDKNANPMTEFFKSQPADFTIRANPTSLTIPVSTGANSTITLASTNNFTGTITLAATSQPTGPSLTLNPTSVTLTAGGSGTSTLTFTTNTKGNYTDTVKATSSTLSHNTTIAVGVAPPDFTISTTPSSLTFGQLTSTAGSSIVVNSTGDRTYFESSYLQTSFQAKGLIWLFYEDSRSTCEHLTGCMFYTTSTNGTHWASPTKVPVHITDSDFSVYTNGTSVFYVRYNETSYDSNCGRNIQFGLGTLNTSGAITWHPERTVATGAANRAYPDDEITVDSNGQVWIAYLIDNKSACGGTGTERPQIIHSAGTNYGSWLGNTTLCVAACHSLNWHIELVSIGAGEIYSLYWITRYGIHGRLYNGTFWNAEETISTDVTDVNNWLFNTGTSIYAIYFDNITETYNFGTRSTTGAWTGNLIGAAETHDGTLAFAPSYYSLPDAASYDAKDNLFDLFYMNATTQRIDQWSGSGTSWTKTIGLVSTPAVPYSDSISSFIQSGSTVMGSIFYISGSTSFTINSASISFTPAGNTGTFKVTIAGKYGFSSTVNLSTTITPSTGLTSSCSPTSIPGGSGSSTCTLTATTKGNYTVTVSATNGTITHTTIVTVTVLAFPDFTITISQPSPLNAGQFSKPTITMTALNGFNRTVTLTDNPPTGLACSTITPGSLTGSGTATVSCSAAIAGNYTMTVTGTNGALSHSATVIITVQDYAISANLTRVKLNAGSTGSSSITVIPLNHFSGNVTLSASATTGLNPTINPTSILFGSGTATLTFMSTMVGNYTITVASSSGTLTHTSTVIVQTVDFTLNANSTTITVLASATVGSTVMVDGLNGFSGTVSLILSSSTALAASITPASLTGSGSSTLLVSAYTSGNYSITIKATSGSLSHLMGVVVRVLDYSLSGNPTSLSVPIGTNTSSTLTLKSLNGYAGNLSLTYTVQAISGGSSSNSGSGGANGRFILAPPMVLPIVTINPQSLQLSPGGTLQSTVSISLPTNLPSGNYLITIAATGALIHQIVLNLAATDFSLTATPNSATLRPGSNTTILLNLQSLNFFQGNVSLTVTSQAGGPTGTLSTSTFQLTYLSNVNLNLTIQAPITTLLGNYTITIQATSGTVSHTLLIPVRVTATGFVTILAGIFNTHNAISISSMGILTLLTILVTLRIRNDQDHGSGVHRRRNIQNRIIRRSATYRKLPISSTLPPLWRSESRDRF
jgi:hypothetical protein